MQPSRRLRRRSSRGPGRRRFNYTAMSLAFVAGFLVPMLIHGMSLFVAAFLPLIVFAASPLIVPFAG